MIKGHLSNDFVGIRDTQAGKILSNQVEGAGMRTLEREDKVIQGIIEQRLTKNQEQIECNNKESYKPKTKSIALILL